MSLGSNGVNRVCLLRKIMTRLRGTNFSTSLARFAPNFVRQRNGPKCIQIVQYTPKEEFGVQWGGSVAFVEKKFDATSWHELLHLFGPFCTVFCNATERSQMHQNILKRYEPEFWLQWGGLGAFIAKNSDTTSWHELLHHFGPFCTEFCTATKRSQMHPKSTKHTKT